MVDHSRRDKYSQRGNNEDELPGVLVQEDGTVSLPFAVMVLGILFAASGRWFSGFLIGTTGLVFAVCNSAMDQLREEDKQDIRYNIMEADDVVNEMRAWEAAMKSNVGNNPPNEEEVVSKARIHCIAGLEALAKKYGRHQQKLAAIKQNKDSKQTTEQPQPASQRPDHHLALLCQQAAYIAYRLFPINEDQVVAAALSLHALVAQDPQVRQRHLFEADAYGLDLPVQCMKDSLKRAKDETNEDKEQQSAELQRKACLLLGALGDGDADVATKIVDEGGLEAVLETMNWYRYHEDIANWALWAVFILSYENPSNKVTTVELGGVAIIVQALRNAPGCLEVARHGVAILFDLLREDKSSSNQQLDVWRIRKSALAAGLHEAVLQAMAQFSNIIDIMMMGQEILAGTDFRGQAPQYEPNSEDVAG